MPLGFYYAQYHPLNDTDPVGGDISTITLPPDNWDNFFPYSELNTMTEKIWYYKFFIKNEDASLTVQITELKILNWLTESAGTVLQFQYDPAQDGGKKVRIVSYDSTNSQWVIEEVVLDSASSTVNSVNTHDLLRYVELLDDTGNPVTPLADIVIVDANNTATQLGIIPTGYQNSSVFNLLNADSAVDNLDTAPNRLTAPTGRTFTNTGSYDNTLSPSQYWGVWIAKRTIPQMPPLIGTPQLVLTWSEVWS